MVGRLDGALQRSNLCLAKRKAWGRHLRNPESARMSRSNIVYLFIGALVVAVAVLGYQLYKD